LFVAPSGPNGSPDRWRLSTKSCGRDLELMHFLLDAGVVDEVRMMVCPVSRGKGTRVFEDRRDLRPVEATLFENGVVLLRYEIKK
jgi:dihydrofolate reductase